MYSFLVTSANIAISDISLKTRFFGVHFCRTLYRSIFDHFYIIGSQATEVGEKTQVLTAVTPFNAIEGHRFWYQSKAHMQ